MKIFTVIGARPQFVKAAVVSKALKAHGLQEVLVHTGQHFDANMSDVFFEQMLIPRPTHRLDIHGGGHGDMTGRMMSALEPLMIAEKPDWVLVYGDTNSTLAGAVNAAKLHIPLAHIEAGLRSFDRTMPEEINRVLTDHVASMLFVPTKAAIDNLKSEGITKGVHFVGDVMYDSTLMLSAEAAKSSTIIKDLGLARQDFALVTLHRASTTDNDGALFEALSYIRQQANGQTVVLPLHPRTKATAERLGLSLDGFKVIDPVGPLDMHALLGACTQVFTDSGGVQKEAYFHKKPCTTLRDQTEWVETISSGWNRLWKGADFISPRQDIADYGDGHASERIAAILAEAR